MPLTGASWTRPEGPLYELDAGSAQTTRTHTKTPVVPSIQTQFKVASQQSQMTPPITPVSAVHVSEQQETHDQVFRNYLRAFHPFDPSSSLSVEDAASITIRLRQGDLVLVHSVHANGWADGTVLTTGSRGWFPTNYCEAYDHPYTRNLLSAMTQLWDLLGDSENGNLSTFVRQDYIRGLIAGVRYLLERADCLHRDASWVQQLAGVRRLRKGLLADLSSLVQMSKRLQETITEPYAGEVVHVLLDELVAKAFKIVTRAVRFTDVWTQETTGDQKQRPRPTNAQEPITPPVEDFKPTRRSKTSSRRSSSLPPDSAKCFTSDSMFPDYRDSIEVPKMPTGLAGSVDVPNKQQGDVQKVEPCTHRLSLVHPPGISSQDGLASVKLAAAHDAFIGHIGTFIGHHLQNRSSSELLMTTNRSVEACENVIAVIGKVYANNAHHADLTGIKRSEFRDRLEALKALTYETLKSLDVATDVVVVLPDQSDKLVEVATCLIRTAGECVVKTRQLIEQTGDFELDRPSDMGNATSKVDADEDAQPGAERRSRLSGLMLPPPPPPPKNYDATIETQDFAPHQTTKSKSCASSPAKSIASRTDKPLPTPPVANEPPKLRLLHSVSTGNLMTHSPTPSSDSVFPSRKSSIGVSVGDPVVTNHSSLNDSEYSKLSEASTRATTPELGKLPPRLDQSLIASFGSISSMRSAATDVSNDAETQLLQKSFAHELVLNKDFQVTGGSLQALVEQLTMHDNAPCPQFVTAFYLTFRQFTTPRELANTLIHRFEYIGDSRVVGSPVRLRIYNFFKGWLETYWNSQADRDALGDIRYFALHKLKPCLPSAGERLIELMRKITTSYHTGTNARPLVSGVGKTSTSIGSQYEDTTDAPESIVSKSQLSTLRTATLGGRDCSILDFDPMEIARQITLLASRLFCNISAEELLSLEWSKSGSAKANNIRGLCKLNTDLTHLVGDTILTPEEAKKRALVIKKWVKIAMGCLELHNYDSVMAITCSLNSSVVQRLRRTWELVSKKTKTRLDELSSVVDVSRNHASLRRLLETSSAPCLPFLGIYLTDLTFVDAGNPKTRTIPGTSDASGQPVSVINFDKYFRTAKIIGHLQRFQVPYRLRVVREMQTWLESHLHRMRDEHTSMVPKLYRRSIVVEPKAEAPMRTATSDSRSLSGASMERPKTAGEAKETAVRDRFDSFFTKGGSFSSLRSLGKGEGFPALPPVPAVPVGVLEERERKKSA